MKHFLLSDFRRVTKAILYGALTLVMVAGSLTSCGEDPIQSTEPNLNKVDQPTMGTPSVVASTIVHNGATIAFSVDSDGGMAPNQVGICWSTTKDPKVMGDPELPNIADETCARRNLENAGVGDFNGAITGLTHSTKYYVRAYASNAKGTSYSQTVEFTTAVQRSPTVGTTTSGTILYNGATISSSVTDEGDMTLNLIGVCWSKQENPTKGQDGTTHKDITPVAMGSFSTAITGLEKNTLYYVRAYAGSTAGTAYGEQISFITSNVDLPVFTALAIVDGTLTTNSASVKTTVSSLGGAVVSEIGIEWAAKNDFATVLGSKKMTPVALGDLQADITGLVEGNTYYARYYAKTDAGNVMGDALSIRINLVQSLARYAPKTAGVKMLIGTTAIAPLGTNPGDDALIKAQYNALQIPVYGISFNGWTSKEVHSTLALQNWVTWCNANSIEPVGHFLVGGNDSDYMPAWFKDGTWTTEELKTMLEDRIKTMIQAAPSIKKWVVVNEFFNSGNRNYTANKFSTIGVVATEGTADPNPANVPLYIELALTYARKYAPTAELLICERGMERSMLTEVRSTSLNQLITHLKKREIPIDGVCFQGHQSFAAGGWATETIGSVGGTPAPIRWDLTVQQIERLQKAGMKVYFNELDCGRNNGTTALTEADQAEYNRLQVKHYTNYITAIVEGIGGPNPADRKTLEQPGGIFFWGIGDGRDPAYRYYDQPTLFNNDLTPKPAYTTLLEYLYNLDKWK